MKIWTAGTLVFGVGVALSLRAYDLAHARYLPSPSLGDRTACQAYAGLPEHWGRDEHAGMQWIAAGSFDPGSTEGYADERPAQSAARVDVAGFWIDRTEVSNAQFSAFVAATHYVTLAEREGASAVFHVPSEDELNDHPQAWWRRVSGASWRKPRGPDSDLVGRANRPVVHIAYEDALAYATWLGRALPTEDQWEYAARAGQRSAALHHAPIDPSGAATANFWQGEFPIEDRAEDGFAGVAPVGCFAANPWGLHDMIGNVWEWTADAYRPRSEAPEHDPAPASPSCSSSGSEASKVIKGGSFLCASNFCARYRVSARHPHEASMSTEHIGFRTVSAR